MNCCDYDCNQGRDCPARKPVCLHCFGIGYDASGQRCTCTATARVAKVGRRIHAADPLPRSPWPVYLKDLARSMLLAIVLMLVTALALPFFR